MVAIDGKTLRRSFDRGREQSPLHLVSAWASEQGLVLGQRCVDGKSNEITAIPELLDQLALENSIVTLDAMGCQTAIAEQILARGGDYLLALKANHPLAYAAVVEAFRPALLPPWRSAAGRLRRLRRDAWPPGSSPGVRQHQGGDLEALSAWPGLHTVLAVESIRSVNGTPKVETEIRYFLSSCRDDPAVLGRGDPHALGDRECVALGAGRHFPRGRQPRARPHAARNLALLRKIAINCRA